MLNEKFFIFLFLAVDLTLSVKPTDFCILKQEECKGYYDINQIYHTKCSSIRCHGKLKHDCGSNVCSKNKIDCEDFVQVDSYLIFLQTLQFSAKYSKEIKKMKDFNKSLQECPKMIYKFKSDDFCVNGKNCFEIKNNLKGFGFSYRKLKTTEKIDCKCPRRQNFKCGEYCSTNSIACDYHKSTKNQTIISRIKDCGNHNKTIYKSMYYH